MDGIAMGRPAASGGILINRPATEKPDGPQLITFLDQSVRGLRELRARLVNVNAQLRGTIPPPPNDSNEIQKQPEVHLASLLSQLNALVELCHREVGETSALLT